MTIRRAKVVLDGERHTGQGPFDAACINIGRALPGTLCIHFMESIEQRVEPLDAAAR